MLYYYVSIAYTVANLLLAIVVFLRSKRDVLVRFYLFCTSILTILGLTGYAMMCPVNETWRHGFLEPLAVFVYALFPFFFLHFIVIFVRQYELLKSKVVIGAIYAAGLFGYAMVLAGYVPKPLLVEDGFTSSGYVFYLIWMSILFSIGIALLYSTVESLSRKRIKSRLLFTAFVIILLFLPGPFTESVFFKILHQSVEIYFLSSSFALVLVVYFVFRHRVLVETPYEALKTALTIVNDILLRLSDTFQIEMARGAVEKLLGYSEKELLGRSLLDFVEQKEDVAMYEHYAREGKMREAYIDVDVASKGNKRMAMNFSFSPLFEADQLVGFVAVGRDVTERKRMDRLHAALYTVAEAAHRAPTLGDLYKRVHEAIQSVMPASNFYIALYDERENLLAFPYFVDETDVTPPSGNVGKGLTAYVLRTGKSLLCDEQTSEVLARQGKAELVGSPSAIWLGVPLVVESKSIGVMVVQHYSNPTAYTSNEQQILEFISSEVARAIDRKRAEEQNQLLARAIESTAELISITDFRDRFVFVNKSFLEAYGYTREEVLGQNPMLIDSPNNPPRLRQDLTGAAHKRTWSGELLNRRKDGSEFSIYLDTSIVYGDQGNVLGLMGVARDLSERKKMQGQLQQAQKLESIGTLAGGVAHDFNNILSIILSYASLIEKQKGDSEKMTQASEMIKKTVYRGANIVRQILTFARKTDATFESLCLNDVVEELAKLLKQTFPETVIFSFGLDTCLPTITADRTQIQQAVLNLAVNARDAMPSGGTIAVKTGVVPGATLQKRFTNACEESYVYVEVSDTGLGMDENVRHRIFEPFFTTKEKGKGTGLGLAVVYGVVESHHGFIDVQSAVEKGTTFSLFFPVRPSGIESLKTPPEEVKEIAGGDETILVVEDEEMLLEMLKSFLESKGYTVITASDGEEALELYKAQQGKIDLVLTDMGLPKISGLDIFRKMKRINPKVRVVIASGYLDPGMKAAMIVEGAKEFIQKPYAPEEILRKTRDAIDASPH